MGKGRASGHHCHSPRVASTLVATSSLPSGHHALLHVTASRCPTWQPGPCPPLPPTPGASPLLSCPTEACSAPCPWPHMHRLPWRPRPRLPEKQLGHSTPAMVWVWGGGLPWRGRRWLFCPPTACSISDAQADLFSGALRLDSIAEWAWGMGQGRKTVCGGRVHEFPPETVQGGKRTGSCFGGIVASRPPLSWQPCGVPGRPLQLCQLITVGPSAS